MKYLFLALFWTLLLPHPCRADAPDAIADLKNIDQAIKQFRATLPRQGSCVTVGDLDLLTFFSGRAEAVGAHTQEEQEDLIWIEAVVPTIKKDLHSDLTDCKDNQDYTLPAITSSFDAVWTTTNQLKADFPSPPYPFLLVTRKTFEVGTELLENVNKNNTNASVKDFIDNNVLVHFGEIIRSSQEESPYLPRHTFQAAVKIIDELSRPNDYYDPAISDATNDSKNDVGTLYSMLYLYRSYAGMGTRYDDMPPSDLYFEDEHNND